MVALRWGCLSELREQILLKFYEKAEHGEYLNAGWPNYVKGLLTSEEIEAVENFHRRFFLWEVRFPRIIDMLTSSNADIISLVELDEYDAFAEALSDWDSVFRKRPRRSSKDGCGVFWRRTKFQLGASEGFDFVDREDTGQTLKDRTCLLVLLRFVASPASKVLVISTHLARNPECPNQTKVRARQTAQLMRHLTDFAHRNKADEAPVILMGDLNAQHFGEIRGIARTVFQVSTIHATPSFSAAPTCPRAPPPRPRPGTSASMW